MKRLTVLLLALLVSVSFAFSQDNSFVFRPTVGVTLGSKNALRGAIAEAHLQYNLLGTGLHLGLETSFQYDAWYGNMSLPVASTFGFGKDFYLIAGTTFDLTQATNPLMDDLDAEVGSFFNTFGLGTHFAVFLVPE